ncbi:isochorismatase family protein [Candidatus Endoriftia persephone]|jgi:nicotinamidase-related amidase|uniref:Isochorismatase hydrolase n=3 Tax=Gammaproteobacteria TaxID=1236 RepID=G2FJP3_9GAMM|nr:isochorismatase family protein [Candidatus Endoriftia persephone]EGV51717.1 isochorismatase hydrolase [endosymbiont of Riftia pachyptila (vent Ph05)]EGW52995.1 isochorismatase hydrolase [endosymbiont of Tevnia jerichonana (vent Tica)]USF87971.1 isochorismatase family protein [Candidatus Endoriftia persephone]
MNLHKVRLPLAHAKSSQLLIINVQEKLAKAMYTPHREQMLININRLSQAARILEIPVVLSEHYAKGLGRTLPEITQHLAPEVDAKDRLAFSCCTAPGFEEELERAEERKQIIIVGLESHICVLQTASGLQQWGYQVFVVEDAIASRSSNNRRNAIERLRGGEVIISNAESVAYEWLSDAGHAHFKEVTQLFR